MSGLVVIETELHNDERGFFTRLYCQKELGDVVGARQIVQINRSCTRTVGAVRGMHFQHEPHAEMKLVRCIKGKVWDVAVDLRAGSSTFLNWHAEEISAENARMIVIPEGFAHGFRCWRKTASCFTFIPLTMRLLLKGVFDLRTQGCQLTGPWSYGIFRVVIAVTH